MRVRIARHTVRLDDAVAFHRDAVGLRETGRLVDRDGCDGVFLEVPGAGAELELTTGGGSVSCRALARRTPAKRCRAHRGILA